ncbi:MAG: hypothetical protein WBG92_05310 [Thiohalocapsa sp.]
MKTIPAAEVYVDCVSSDIEPSLAEALDAAYPDDQARSYALGDIRGAFTLVKPLRLGTSAQVSKTAWIGRRAGVFVRSPTAMPVRHKP